MMDEKINEIGKEISLAYKFHQGYGYFMSATVAQWLGIEYLPDWPHQTILDLIAVDLILDAARNGNEKARQLLNYFTLHGSYSGRKTISGSGLVEVESMLTALDLQTAIAPQFIPEFEQRDVL